MTPSVLVVSKPLIPPWNDSSKNLARDIVLGTDRAHFTVLTAGDFRFDRPTVREYPIYSQAGKLAPSARQNVRVVRVLWKKNLGEIHHFFFAPNPRTGRIVRWLRRLHRPPAIHTLCSVPHQFATLGKALFADVNVALSRFTQERLVALGVPRVRFIPPCIPPLEPLFDESTQQHLRRSLGLVDDQPLVLYPGDYEYSRAALTVAEAAKRLARSNLPITWVFACRLKSPLSRAVEGQIKTELAGLAEDGRAVFFNQVPRMPDLIKAADLVVLPAETTYAKMDLPLVLLEAMALGRPVIVADVAPLNELPVASGGWTVRPDDPAQLADVIAGALEQPEERLARGRQGARIVSEQYSRSHIADQYAQLYNELASSRGMH